MTDDRDERTRQFANEFGKLPARIYRPLIWTKCTCVDDVQKLGPGFFEMFINVGRVSAARLGTLIGSWDPEAAITDPKALAKELDNRGVGVRDMIQIPGYVSIHMKKRDGA